MLSALRLPRFGEGGNTGAAPVPTAMPEPPFQALHPSHSHSARAHKKGKAGRVDHTTALLVAGGAWGVCVEA